VDVIAVQRLEALNNSVWYALRLNSTLTVENNQNSVDQSGVYMPYALPRKYSELDGLVTFDAAPDQAYPYKARVAVWPTEGSYFESVPIPEDFKMMLVEGAMAILWEFGDTRDPRLADRAGMAYENHLRNFGAHVWTTGGEAKFTKVSLSPYRRR
jgi:hypothetical protein